jgi:hypothetical protein
MRRPHPKRRYMTNPKTLSSQLGVGVNSHAFSSSMLGDGTPCGHALKTISMPCRSSWLAGLTLSSSLSARSNGTPPPGRMPAATQLEATAEKISSRCGHRVAPPTISRWVLRAPRAHHLSPPSRTRAAVVHPDAIDSRLLVVWVPLAAPPAVLTKTVVETGGESPVSR